MLFLTFEPRSGQEQGVASEVGEERKEERGKKCKTWGKAV
jgi:hypothetical protein